MYTHLTGMTRVATDAHMTTKRLRKLLFVSGFVLTVAYILTATLTEASIRHQPTVTTGSGADAYGFSAEVRETGLDAQRFREAQTALQDENYFGAALPLRLLSEQGHREAQFLMGIAYSNGLGVHVDMGQAVHWYRRAAVQGHMEAQYNLGVAYSMGSGVALDASQAAGWYRKAALQGSTDAQFNLGLLYAQGEGVNRDMLEAAKWWYQAAVHGDAAAQYALGLMYVRGDGVDQDLNEAVKWWYMSASQGFERAQNALNKLRLLVVPE